MSGLDKAFDYLVPTHLEALVEVGTRVRVDLHGRRVGGWILALSDDTAAVEPGRLKSIAKITGAGPNAEIIELAEWASERWAAGRIRPFLVTASPGHAVPSARTASRPSSRATSPVHGPTSPATTGILEDGAADGAERRSGVLRLPPRADVMPAVLSAVTFARRRSGSVLVVAPAQGQVAVLAIRLGARRARGGD